MLTKTKITDIGLAAGVVAISRLGLGSWVELSLVVLAVLLADAIKQPKLRFTQRFLNLGLVTSLSFGLLIVIAPRPIASLVISILMVAWLWGQQRLNIEVKAILSQFIVTWAIYLATGIWHWPAIVALALTWGGSYLIALHLLGGLKEKIPQVLASAWALIATQVAWVFTVWLVNYVLIGGILIIPQPAIVLTALGYCFGGIYLAHLRSQLSRSRLIEYLLIGVSLLLIVIAGTKWNGSV